MQNEYELSSLRNLELKDILPLVEADVMASSSTMSAIYFLQYSGCPVFPLDDNTNMQFEMQKYQGLLNEDLIRLLLDKGALEDKKGTLMLNSIVSNYITTQLSSLKADAAGKLANEGYVSGEFGKSEQGQAALQTLRGIPISEADATLQDRFYSIRSQLSGGNYDEAFVNVFSEYEKLSSQFNIRELFKVAEIVQRLGMTVDQYLTLSLGETPDTLEEKMTVLLNCFDAPDEKVSYFELNSRSEQVTNGEPTANSSVPLLSQIGVSQEEWEANVAICNSGINQVPSAYYYRFPQTPTLALSEAVDAAEWAGKSSWKEIEEGKRVGITYKQGNSNKNSNRLAHHEEGHALMDLLLVSSGEQLAPEIKKSTIEISSLHREFELTDVAYVKAREEFFIRRYAGLSLMNIALYRSVEQSMELFNDNPEEVISRIFQEAADNYQSYVGDRIGAIMPQGRAVNDFFYTTSPLTAATYPLALPIALHLKKQTDSLQTPEDRRHFLTSIYQSINAFASIDEVMKSLGIEWENACQDMVRYLHMS